MTPPEFIIVPFRVLTDGEISHAAKLTYGRLKLYAGADGRAFPKHETLATELCITGRQLRRVLDELRRAGWISWTRARTSCIYTVHSNRTETSSQIGQKCPITSDRNVRSRSDRNVLQKRSIEDHHHQKRIIEERQSKQQPSSEGPTGPAKPSKKPKPISLNVDDDEKPKPPLRGNPGPQYVTPRDELIGLMEAKYGVRPSARTLSRIQAKLDSRFPPATWQDLLDVARPELERGALNNPEGFIVATAKDLHSAAKRPEAKEAPVPKPEPEKCPLCGCPKGRGVRMSSDGRRLVFCPCATAEFKEEKAGRGFEEEAA